ncbi:PepSY-associated TM helix domain-containing protein [Solimonas sp. SE-A11]|uniref:PepSY-associated TM helix domain-containing protein n=1 Tax=Solimonas sp. SE-A11 TaxID=3054954 RepID=UPI00259CC323|nr:PepSY-associated TM helix domain-containing protein [Solimonas sp. SE-A11]MDM4769281.1 PepSY-associated TM helix domain-containing protein [Solimonas sp. SE-A11]
MQAKQDQKRRAFWLKHLHQWHWISSALCLIGMILFAATGITLNHASQIKAKVEVVTQTAQLPEPLRAETAAAAQAGTKGALPPVLAAWLQESLSVEASQRDPEWNDGEIYLSLPRPGGDAWVSFDLESGEVEYEQTDRGWISYFNDLHKGRNAGVAWGWFIDLFAVACLIFCITGLFLLQIHAGNRPATWPIVGLGLVIPLVLAILFIH